MTSLPRYFLYLGPTLASDSTWILLNFFFCLEYGWDPDFVFWLNSAQCKRITRKLWVKIDWVVQMDIDLTSLKTRILKKIKARKKKFQQQVCLQLQCCTHTPYTGISWQGKYYPIYQLAKCQGKVILYLEWRFSGTIWNRQTLISRSFAQRNLT